MIERVAIDTNILVYAEGVNDETRKNQALALLNALEKVDVVLPVQAMGELFRVLTHKKKCSPAKARESVLRWRNVFGGEPTHLDTLEAAMALAAEHSLSIWDAVILCVASQAKCRWLLSEDMNEGFAWRGVTILNPFAANLHPLYAAFLKKLS